MQCRMRRKSASHEKEGRRADRWKTVIDFQYVPTALERHVCVRQTMCRGCAMQSVVQHAGLGSGV